ncbi:hypothetical protein FACS18949_16360 [Clostridia bacterium]|nr:hypothetical protein FACS18949_16360 [Clostridia bacterium]
MKKAFLILVVALMICATSISALAVTTITTTSAKNWTSSTFPTTGGKDFRPPSGYTQATFYNKNGSGQNEITSRVSFTLTSANVTAIAQHKAGTHSSHNGMNLFFGSEMVSVPTSGNDLLSATSIASSLPDPHFDIEDDDGIFGNGRYEESEVVALGTVTASTYYQSTQWDDFRNGSAGGRWTVNFHESGLYWGSMKLDIWVPSFGDGDYNTVEYEGLPSTFIQTYGNTSGQS